MRAVDPKEYLVGRCKVIFGMRPFNKVREEAIENFNSECSLLGFNRDLIFWKAKMSVKIAKAYDEQINE